MKETTGPAEFYPELRSDYSNIIGSVGELAVTLALDDYSISPHNVNEPGVDIHIEDYDIGIEVWNHRKQHAYIDKLEGVVNNLSTYQFRFLYTSFISPKFKRLLQKKGIQVIESGFQVIPKKYLSFYNQQYGLKRKKTINKRTLKTIKNILRLVYECIRRQQFLKDVEQFNDLENIRIDSSSNHSHVCNNTKICWNYANLITIKQEHSTTLDFYQSEDENTKKTGISQDKEEPLPEPSNTEALSDDRKALISTSENHTNLLLLSKTTSCQSMTKLTWKLVHCLLVCKL